MKYRLIDGSLNDAKQPIKTVLKNRGIDDIDTYISLSEEHVEPWEHLDNINEAVECFVQHFDNFDTIAILSDTDPDGVCSSVIMYKYIKAMKDDYPVFLILHENNKAHGLNSWDFTIPDSTKLLIIPDAATNDTDECQKLLDDGISVIALDHHQKSDERTNPAIVVNNQISDGYYNKNACGAHVTYDFLRALDDYYWESISDNFVDLVALADISDVMDISSESTRALINVGLQNVSNKMFAEIIKAQDFSMKGKVNPHTVAFYVTPLVNSFLRLATLEERMLLIRAFCEDESETFEYTKRGESFPIEETIYEHVIRMMKSYKGKQDRTRDKVFDALMSEIDEDTDDKVAIIDATGKIDASITGLVSIKISEAIHKPVMIVRKRGDELAGSARVFNNCCIEDFRSLADSCPHVAFAQGHPSACGISFYADKIDNARQWFNEQLKDVSMEKIYYVDFVIDANDLDVGFIQEINNNEHLWGHGVDEPLVAVTDIIVKRKDLHVQGKNYDSIAFTVNDIKYVVFKLKEDNPLLQFATDWGNDDAEIALDVVGTVSISEYKGIFTPQVMIKEIGIKEN